MNSELKKKWVEALRSGKYKQGKRVLKEKIAGVEHYCCLGVLCDVDNKSLWEKQSDPNREGLFSYMGLINSLPDHLLQELQGNLYPDREQRQLMIMNDCGKSFEEIAGLIEECIEET